MTLSEVLRHPYVLTALTILLIATWTKFFGDLTGFERYGMYWSRSWEEFIFWVERVGMLFSVEISHVSQLFRAKYMHVLEVVKAEYVYVTYAVKVLAGKVIRMGVEGAGKLAGWITGLVKIGNSICGEYVHLSELARALGGRVLALAAEYGRKMNTVEAWTGGVLLATVLLVCWDLVAINRYATPGMVDLETS